jgi:hypothetical protein
MRARMRVDLERPGAVVACGGALTMHHPLIEAVPFGFDKYNDMPAYVVAGDKVHVFAGPYLALILRRMAPERLTMCGRLLAAWRDGQIVAVLAPITRAADPPDVEWLTSRGGCVQPLPKAKTPPVPMPVPVTYDAYSVAPQDIAPMLESLYLCIAAVGEPGIVTLSPPADYMMHIVGKYGDADANVSYCVDDPDLGIEPGTYDAQELMDWLDKRYNMLADTDLVFRAKNGRYRREPQWRNRKPQNHPWPKQLEF